MFKNKIVLVTGSSHGIGASLVQEYAKYGADTVINYLSSKKEAQKIKEGIGNGNSLIIKADVAKEKDVREMAEKIIRKFGRIDILINNAGAVFEPASWDKINHKNFIKTINVNLIGVFNCLKLIIPHMVKNRYGKIVNISSLSAITGPLNAPAYSSSKAGVLALTKGFALQGAPYVNVNAIAPSWVNTRWHKNKGRDFFQYAEKHIPLKRIAEVKDIVNLVIFLTSDNSSYITGQTIVIDGGLSL